MQSVNTQAVLSIECGTPYLSLGLTVNGHSIGGQGVTGHDVAGHNVTGRAFSFSRVTEVGRTHAERLPAELEALFAEAALPLRADKIVIGSGPGSYTGLRVGASYALGLGRAWGVPVLGVCTLEGLAGAEDGVVAVSLDARKEHVYGAVYRLVAGVVAETLHPAARYPLTNFGVLAAGLEWRRDVPPDPLVLARNGLDHGHEEWELVYL